MKKIILTILVLILTAVYLKNMQNNEQDNTLVKNVIESDINHIKSRNEKKEKKYVVEKITDEHLLHIAQMIAPPSNQELKDTWRNEYSCEQKFECLGQFFNARSYEDALWLKRKGYPSLSAVNLLKDVSKNDLIKLSNHGNTNASALLALDNFIKGDYRRAANFAFDAAVNNGPMSRETFGYRLEGEALVLNHQPMAANLYLRIAAILGDTGAESTYARITANTAVEAINATNRAAYALLQKNLNTDINNLNNDPRPTGGGGG